jgi:hypothetical protein
MKQKEKTIKQWLNTLKEPYKTKALQQTNKDILKEKVIGLEDAMYKMFDWESSEEGLNYWCEVMESLDFSEV